MEKRTRSCGENGWDKREPLDELGTVSLGKIKEATEENEKLSRLWAKEELRCLEMAGSNEVAALTAEARTFKSPSLQSRKPRPFQCAFYAARMKYSRLDTVECCGVHNFDAS